MAQFTIFMLTGAAFSAAIGQLLFRVGARGSEGFYDFVNLPILSGLALYGFGTVIWIYVLSKESLVDVYAFTALTFVLVYLGGVFLLGEHLDLIKSIGILFVLFGLYLITRSPGIA